MGGKAYFVKGASYVRFDIDADRVDSGYPKPMAGNWRGISEAGFGSGVDAAVNWAGGKVYFFRGDQYVRYDIARNAVDDGYPLLIADQWVGFADAGFADGIDAAVDLGDGSALFFERDQCLRYGGSPEAILEGPAPIAAFFPNLAGTGLEAGVSAAIGWNPSKGYLFDAEQYVRVDLPTRQMDDGYPLAIVDFWSGFGAAGFSGGLDAAWINAAGVSGGGGGGATARSFFDRYHGFAEQSEVATTVPALVALGQAALESGWGQSAPRNNFFGIKAKATDPEETRQLLKTTEVLNRPDVTGFPEIISVTPRPDGRFTYVVRDWFRVYPSPAEAFVGHGKFLRDNRRYGAAFDHLDDPYAFAREVARAGYATAPNYADVLERTMHQIEDASH